MTSIWDLLPASLWPVQPIDPMLPSLRPHETAPLQGSGSATSAFGWPSAPPTTTPTFGWPPMPPAPANAPAYSGATDPDALLGSFPDVEIPDPARSRQLLQDAKRAHAFAQWWFGPPSVRPPQQTRYAAAAADAPRPIGPVVGIDNAADAPPPIAATQAWPGAQARSSYWHATHGVDTAPPPTQADNSPWATVDWQHTPFLGPILQMGETFGNGFRAGQVPRAVSPQATYRAAQAGDESYMPPFQQTGPSVLDVVTGIPGGLADTARMATTPPPPMPPNVFIKGDGFYVGRYPDGRLVRWEDADPDAANAYYEEMQKRAELPARIALDMLGGGAGFAERGALGAAGGRFLTGQLHHAISLPVWRSLENHKNLKGFFSHRDPRLVTQAADLPSHNGWWGWHEGFDAEVATYIDTHPKLTPKTFVTWLRSRYAKPDLKARFPNGLPRRSNDAVLCSRPATSGGQRRQDRLH